MQEGSTEEEMNCLDIDMPEWLREEALYRKIRGCLERMHLFRRKATYQGSVRLKLKRTGTKTKRRDSSGLTRTDATIRGVKPNRHNYSGPKYNY